jgi:hypothetical protein
MNEHRPVAAKDRSAHDKLSESFDAPQ